jgi:hypothetical protein
MNVTTNRFVRSLIPRAIRRIFAIDPRSLAAARIVIGIVLVIDLLERFTDLHALYSADGAIPLEIVRERFSEPWRWSLHYLSGSPLYNGALMGLALLSAVALLVGARTRIATVVSWLLLLSLHHRLPPVNNAGDSLLLLLLFWAMFLPWERCWSLDACYRWKRTTSAHLSDPGVVRAPVISAASCGILLQVAIMYGMTGYFKQHELWQSGSALQFVLAFDAYGKSTARRLLEYPQLLTWLSWGTLWLETIGPWLWFFPWFTGIIRVAVCGLLFLMHVGIALTLTVGLFSYVCLAGLLLFVPAAAWDRLNQWISRRPAEGRRDEMLLPESAEPLTKWQIARHTSLSTVCLLSLVLIIAWNIQTMFPRVLSSNSSGRAVVRRLPNWLVAPMSALGLVQKWNMFSRPPKNDEWFTATGRLVNGETRDVWSGNAARDPFESPTDPAGMFPNHRWRKLFRQLPRDRYEAFRAPVGRWVVQRWNQLHAPQEQIIYFTLDHTTERIQEGDLLARMIVTRLYTEGDAWQ